MARIIRQTDDARSREAQAYKGASTLVKCLTEILLNSYESYQRLEKKGIKAKPTITIHADSREESVEVIDHFEGLAESEEKGIAILEKKSAKQPTHTAESRAAMGRGMSDVLFRRSQNIAILAWRRDGKTFAYKAEYKNDSTDLTPQNEEDPFLIEEIEKKIPENGTLVKWYWREVIEESPFPTFDEIKNMLGHYFELKNMLKNEKFSVNLEYSKKDGKNENDRIKFIAVDCKEIKSLGNTDLGVNIPDRLERICKCGHEDARHDSNCNDCSCKEFRKREYDIRILSAKLFKTNGMRLNTAHDDMRTQGLYIEGEHEQVYTMEFFGLEDRYPVEAPYIFGNVILSKDAKQYMMDMYNFQKIEILSQTRTGFEKILKNRLYHSMSRILKPWIESVLKSQSRVSMDTKDTSGKKGLSKLNEILKKISEIDDAHGEGGGEEGPDDPEIPEYAAFEHGSYQITKEKIQRIKLLVNPKKFKIGTKLEWNVTDSDLKIEKSINNIPSTELDLLKIPILVKSEVKGDLGQLSVSLKSKDGPVKPEPSTLIQCVDEKDVEPFHPHDMIEFNPKSAKTKILKSKSIDLYTQGNVVKPGTDISIQFKPDDNSFSTLQPIEIKGPTKIQITAPEYKFTFKLEDSPQIMASQDYRKTTITFEGIQPGLKGIIEAKTSVDGNPYDSQCKFEFEQNDDGDDGGKFKQWQAERLTSKDKPWIYEGGVAIANLAIPHVSRMLGTSDQIAKARFELYEETKLFVADGITTLAFEESVIGDFGKHNAKMEQEGKSSMDRYKHLRTLTTEWEMMWTDEIFEDFNVRPRTKVPEGGKINEHKITVQFPFAFDEYTLKSYSSGESVIDNGFFDDENLKNVKRRRDIDFKFENETITVGVYEFDNAVAVRMDSFDWNGEMQPVLLPLRGKYQVYKKPEKIPQGIAADWWYTPVEVNEYQTNKIKKISITLENALKIPDSPRSFGKEMPYEDDNTWILNDKKMVEYRMFDDVINHNGPSNRRGQLVSFIQKDDFKYMALNFVRQRILRPMTTYYFVTKKILPNTKNAKCEKCGLDATSNESVKNSFGLFLDNDKPAISKYCKQH